MNVTSPEPSPFGVAVVTPFTTAVIAKFVGAFKSPKTYSFSLHDDNKIAVARKLKNNFEIFFIVFWFIWLI